MSFRMSVLFVWIALAGDTRMKARELAEMIGVSVALCRKTVTAMVELGLLTRSNGRVWRAVDDARAAEILRALRMRAP